ncbi:MAG: hypothetical protein R3D68_07040 [Hyphomicrobiaceae bacterium]
MFLLLAFASSIAWSQEMPLGGKFSDLKERFNHAAATAHLDVKLDIRTCEFSGSLCPVSFNGRGLGHVTKVEDRDQVETFLLIHACDQRDGELLADVARIFVRLFGAKSAPATPKFSALANSISGVLPEKRTRLVIGGVEFVNSRISCTLFVGRPQR